ncbi:MAG: nuclear transport factor 2 family protein, partial [Cyanobacteria bacterium]|nr:nuclear transport factor 2 family protein [Cyanobacteriota bacterium]
NPSAQSISTECSTIIQNIFNADSKLDTEAFLELLSPNVTFRMGSQTEIQGKASVGKLVQGLFDGMQAVHHSLKQSWQNDNSLVYEAEVTFHLKDGRVFKLPYVNVLQLGDNQLIDQYKIYIDVSPLYSE